MLLPTVMRAIIACLIDYCKPKLNMVSEYLPPHPLSRGCHDFPKMGYMRGRQKKVNKMGGCKKGGVVVKWMDQKFLKRKIIEKNNLQKNVKNVYVFQLLKIYYYRPATHHSIHNHFHFLNYLISEFSHAIILTSTIT